MRIRLLPICLGLIFSSGLSAATTITYHSDGSATVKDCWGKKAPRDCQTWTTSDPAVIGNWQRLAAMDGEEIKIYGPPKTEKAAPRDGEGGEAV